VVRRAGPPVDLPQQGLLTGDVDETGLPRIGAPTPDPAILAGTVGQPPWPPQPGLVHPSTVVSSGSRSSTAPCTTTARCTVGHDTRCAAATSDWSRPSSAAAASAVRSRAVVRIPAGTCCSVNVCRSQSSLRHRQRRFRHNTTASSPPHGRSRPATRVDRREQRLDQLPLLVAGVRGVPRLPTHPTTVDHCAGRVTSTRRSSQTRSELPERGAGQRRPAPAIDPSTPRPPPPRASGAGCGPEAAELLVLPAKHSLLATYVPAPVVSVPVSVPFRSRHRGRGMIVG
jgi:hypothetical protein